MEFKLEPDVAIIAMAAAIVDRTHDFIEGGWVKGKLAGGFKNVSEFCLHGAMNLALQEMFGETGADGRVNVCGGYAAQASRWDAVEALATAFIVDEARSQHRFRGEWQHGGIAAAPFNDAPERKHEEVLGVLAAASNRLWNISVGTEDVGGTFDFSKWATAESESEDAKAYLHAALAPG